MLGTLIEKGGFASLRDIALSFLAHIQQLTSDERTELLRLCDEAVANYRGRRGRKALRSSTASPRGQGPPLSMMMSSSFASCRAFNLIALTVATAASHGLPSRFSGCNVSFRQHRIYHRIRLGLLSAMSRPSVGGQGGGRPNLMGGCTVNYLPYCEASGMLSFER